jgi:hypothetical protein
MWPYSARTASRSASLPRAEPAAETAAAEEEEEEDAAETPAEEDAAAGAGTRSSVPQLPQRTIGAPIGAWMRLVQPPQRSITPPSAAIRAGGTGGATRGDAREIRNHPTSTATRQRRESAVSRYHFARMNTSTKCDSGVMCPTPDVMCDKRLMMCATSMLRYSSPEALLRRPHEKEQAGSHSDHKDGAPRHGTRPRVAVAVEVRVKHARGQVDGGGL